MNIKRMARHFLSLRFCPLLIAPPPPHSEPDAHPNHASDTLQPSLTPGQSHQQPTFCRPPSLSPLTVCLSLLTLAFRDPILSYRQCWLTSAQRYDSVTVILYPSISSSPVQETMAIGIRQTGRATFIEVGCVSKPSAAASQHRCNRRSPKVRIVPKAE